MNAVGTYGKVFIVDTNLLFVKRLSEALRERGFEAVHCAEPAYALTMIEWNMPVAILCATSPRESTGFDIPAILRADTKTSHIPVIAIGDRGRQSQLEVMRAGYEDFLDRRLGAEEITSHLVSVLSCHRDGFQPTQMLAPSETAMDGRLSLVDLPGVIQVLSQSRQTGGLHINAGATDGIIFFDAGEIIHAESGQLAGDDAIVQLVKSCYLTKDGVYKFIPGDAGTLRTVQGTLNALILDALRDLDEQERDGQAPDQAEAVSSPAKTESDVHGEIDTPDARDAQAEVLPVNANDAAEVETEVVEVFSPEPGPVGITEPETKADEGSLSESSEGAVPGDSEVHDVPLFEKRDWHPIIDEEALRELNELLGNLNVEEQESHE
jgi:DNA-binding response OmpR family regulator